jgi:hypothetical protein
MLADVSDLELHDLSIPAAAMAEIRAAERCALCGAPPLARDASAMATFDWLTAFDPMQASAVHSNARVPVRWEDVRSRAVIDSQLRAVVPVPAGLLDFIVPRLDADLFDFVPSAFACAVCDRCADGTPINEAVAATLHAAYVALHFDGNESAAAAQPSWPLVLRFLAIVSVAAGRYAREA